MCEMLQKWLNLYFAWKPCTHWKKNSPCHSKESTRKHTANSLYEIGEGLRKMSTEGYLSSTDVSWSLRWITDTLLAPWQQGESQRGENREGRQTDGQERKRGNGKRRNVKSGALEVILAGKLSYHSDLVKALQQVRGERERKRERERTLRYCVSLLSLS